MVQELFERAENCLKEQLPFVLYSKPNDIELIGVFQNNDAVHKVKDFTETGFVFAPFDLSSNAIVLKMDAVEKVQLNRSHESVPIENNSLKNNSEEKSRYTKLISNAIDKIHKGEFNKVVLSRKIEVDCKDDYFDIYLRILNEYKNAFCYFWHHPKIGTWMGATPEILVKSNGSQFTTMSLAGTQNSIGDAMPQWSDKELNEQQLVTDYIYHTLKDKVISLNSSERESVKAGQLWHLRTEMRGTFAPNKFGAVLKALHPTPAVCGSPLKKAKKFILENELYKRTFYTGFLGELNMKSELSRNKNRKNQENSAYRSVLKTSELFVNLRCMQLFKDKAEIYVGGGITADSIPEKEWEETALKSKTMFRILNSK
ncbi:isochorismate synthase [Maribacter spongiicola]|uniref:Isochorismate synthase n=1 Tax=Maribacter spongiicola TaxID=1206753 RepID=A0A4R7K1W0_9FLAO|nr:chorismate-binding protein [Maribacter spongiicola]TDT44840.1 isochorismate synthase [Maribacter spongiicola]